MTTFPDIILRIGKVVEDEEDTVDEKDTLMEDEDEKNSDDDEDEKDDTVVNYTEIINDIEIVVDDILGSNEIVKETPFYQQLLVKIYYNNVLILLRNFL